MACPFFLPVARLSTSEWVHAPRLPLGDPYRGECHASAVPFEPSEAEQRELCNCGYARGRCARMPDDAADAVRFSVLENAGGRVRVLWILEKDYAPVESAVIEENGGDDDGGGNPIRAAQRRAFVESYLRKSAVLLLEAGAGA